MTVSDNLLVRLICPETKQTVKLASADLLRDINSRIEQGNLKNRGGEVVDAPLQAALVREDGAVLYPVRDGISVMLHEEAIPLES